MSCICVLELGNGWAPAVINTNSELILMYQIQKGMHASQSYWIGGSTFLEEGTPVTFFDYVENLTG